MMQKFTKCLILYSIFLLSSCDPKEAISPQPASFTVSATSGKANVTEFTFTVNEVNADAITLFPYGKDKPKLASIAIPKSSFVSGVAIVKFTYAQVGTFSAVVVSNNHKTDGTSIKNTESVELSITITSDKNALNKFSFKASTNVTPDPITLGSDITVTIPYGSDITKQTAVFETDPFTVVKIGSVVQVSGTTVNDFTTPKTYTVVSQDGTTTTDYLVTAVITPPEASEGFKSVTGKLISGNVKNRMIPAFADSVNNFVVFYDTLGTPATSLDSIRINYALTGKFSTVKGVGTAALKQDSLFKAIPANQGTQNVIVIAQDPGVSQKTYSLYAVAAPKLELSFAGLNPIVEGTTTNFGIELRALAQSGKSIATTMDLTLPAGVTLVNIAANGVVVSSGNVINYAKPVTFKITVSDANIGKTYAVTYTATLVQL